MSKVIPILKNRVFNSNLEKARLKLVEAHDNLRGLNIFSVAWTLTPAERDMLQRVMRDVAELEKTIWDRNEAPEWQGKGKVERI